MKLTVPHIRFILIMAVCCLSQLSTFSQISVVSTTGYAVNIDVRPIAIIPTSNSCVNGYNYSVKMRYNITMTGANAPASLYTLQGTVGCGSTASFFDLPNGRGNGTVNSSNAWTSAKNCGTVTVNSMGCTMVTIQIEGLGISSRSLSFAAAPAALSIKLLNFTASTEKNRVKLNWATATETNNEFFSIERSTDGNEWKEIKKIAGAGNSEKVLNYESFDENPVAGNSYYRLKQTDFDGEKSYSDVQLVKFVPSIKGISLYPVPNTGNNITVSGINDYSNYSLTLMNAAGTAVYSTSLTKASVELPALNAGVYIISLKNKVSGESQNLRYVKI